LGGAVLKAANLSGASLAGARDLTRDQIGEAEGNLGTVLPYDLERPALWSIGQGVLHIETAQDVAEEDETREIAHGAAAAEEVSFETEAEPPPMPFQPESGNNEPAEPEITEDSEPEPAQDDFAVADARAEDIHGDEPAAIPPSVIAEPEPETGPADDGHAEPPMAASEPAMPPSEPSIQPEPERQPSAQQPVSMGSNGHSNGHVAQNNETEDRENKHVSWLVGGPRRAGRPARNWRDRA